MDNEKAKCPSCGSTKLSAGTAGMTRHTFIPDGKLMLKGYDLKAFACLSCGYVGFYLPQYGLDALKSKLADS